MMASPAIAVIGAGVNGLSTAVNIQDQLPGAKVTVIADKFDRETTSDGAAGVYRPRYESIPVQDRQLLRQWCLDSWTHYHNLATSGEAEPAGLTIVSIYETSEAPKPEPLYKEYVYSYRQCPLEELRKRFPHQTKIGFGVEFTTVVVEGRWYLPWLMKKFLQRGGRVWKRTVKDLLELCGQYDLVVNCAGLGSRWLVHDAKVIANRGQVVRLRAPWVKHGAFFGESCYILPCKDTVVVGGTRQAGNYNTTTDPEDTRKILKGVYTLVPSLKHAVIDRTWVGLRPYRDPVRVEKEVVREGSKVVKVVHNYGQGGYGVALSWGVAVYTAKLVKEMLQECHNTKAKL